MNIQEFEKFYFSLFKPSSRLIKNAGNIDITVNEMGAYGDTIEAWDGNKQVGYIMYYINEEKKSIHFEIIIVQKEYHNTNVALKLFKKFYQIYKEKYNGWEVEADFFNHDLADMFQSLVDKGWFPMPSGGINKSNVEEETGGDTYEQWLDFTDKTNFDKNRKVDFNSLPVPFKRYKNNRRDNFFGGDVIYKDLSQNDIDNINESSHNLYDGEDLAILMFGGGSKYYGFAGRDTQSSIIADLNVNCLVTTGDYIPLVSATSIDVAIENLDDMINFVGKDTAIEVNICEGQSLQTLRGGTPLAFKSFNELRTYKENNSKVAKTRLKKLL